MTFLQALAQAHQQHEGWFSPGTNPQYPKGSLSWRNNNPGNLRLTPHNQQQFHGEPGYGSFATFPTYEEGLAALQDDIESKIMGRSAHIDYTKDPTFLDYVKVYAPTEDGNNPKGYAQALVSTLAAAGYHVTLDTPLFDLMKLIQPPTEQPSVIIRRLKRIIAQTANPSVKERLQRRLDNYVASLPPNAT